MCFATCSVTELFVCFRTSSLNKQLAFKQEAPRGLLCGSGSPSGEWQMRYASNPRVLQLPLRASSSYIILQIYQLLWAHHASVGHRGLVVSPCCSSRPRGDNPRAVFIPNSQIFVFFLRTVLVQLKVHSPKQVSPCLPLSCRTLRLSWVIGYKM